MAFDMIIPKPKGPEKAPGLICKPETLHESKRKAFTDRFVRGASAGQTFSDLGCKGLRLRVSPDGQTRSFYHSFQLPEQGEVGKRGKAKRGKTKKTAIGHYPHVGLAEARKIVNDQRAAVDDGINPATLAQEAKQKTKPIDHGLTFAQVADIALGNSDNATTQHDMKKHVLPLLGKRPIDQITRKEIGRVLDKLHDPSAPSRAGRMLGHIMRVFETADRRGDIEDNPSLRMKRPHETEGRDRVLTVDELKRVWDATTPDGVGAAIRLLIATGQRRTETGLTEWDHLDLDGPVPQWRIPWQNRKAGTAKIGDHTVFLARQTVEMLKALRDLRAPDAGPYCFSVKNGHRPITGWVKAKALLDVASGVTGYVLHELRHTFITRLIDDLKIRPYIVSRCVSHTVTAAPAKDAEDKISAVTAKYAHVSFDDERREAMQAWADQLFPPPVDNVVKLDERKAS